MMCVTSGPEHSIASMRSSGFLFSSRHSNEQFFSYCSPSALVSGVCDKEQIHNDMGKRHRQEISVWCLKPLRFGNVCYCTDSQWELLFCVCLAREEVCMCIFLKRTPRQESWNRNRNIGGNISIVDVSVFVTFSSKYRNPNCTLPAQ